MALHEDLLTLARDWVDQNAVAPVVFVQRCPQRGPQRGPLCNRPPLLGATLNEHLKSSISYPTGAPFDFGSVVRSLRERLGDWIQFEPIQCPEDRSRSERTTLNAKIKSCTLIQLREVESIHFTSRQKGAPFVFGGVGVNRRPYGAPLTHINLVFVSGAP